MTLITRNFGEIEVDASKIVLFEEGLPGFLNCKQFIIIKEQGDDSNLFCWLQSLDDGDVAFALLDVFKVLPDYSPDFNIEDLSVIDASLNDELCIYNIVVIPEAVSKMTVNLLAPVIFNFRTMKGVQYILETDKYSVKHYIFDEIKKLNTDEEGE